ncbi:MAG: putative TrmH family tRNA/rRNA methyltransferase [candidate division WS2 bacterium]|uniref:TrmH family tRNA/rRNA methyltransferase n=1 Tax=Psychracetigena formicireducens TaxID=2986056 RepID=A0A9E2BHX7_PSYF1|nr:putative TrmH family tRNA/rRNA methyltransferase [Candidatus Psychracetigena formicireducens]MBT9144891.1 putative TrmH family tRNA/rRNA methyltransferase [Candidatus Psychracetigena formicireducens]MBT9149873.1 putative TrmH family tRNA/rRNA methyltransferase [Candidatus Psychracetigena formicireducens]
MEQDFTEIQREIIFGKRVISEALKAGKYIEEVYFSKHFSDNIIQEIKAHNIPTRRVNEDTLTHTCGSRHHQGILAITSTFPFSNMEEVLVEALKFSYPILLALDEIVDPHNLGAIIRSAEGAGVSGIIMSERRTAPLTGAVVKASTGAVFHLKIVKVKNLLASLKVFKEKGFWIMGAHMESDREYFKADFKMPLVLVVGSEGKGLRENIIKECDFLVKIPMLGKITSLNVSVATAIILFEALKQRLYQ